MTAKVRLPRRRIFKLRGNEVELAVGLLLVTLLDTQANATATRDGAPGDAPAPDAHDAHLPTLEQMLGVAPDAVKTISIEELKAHLTPALLADLGLDADFLDLLDHDRLAAIRSLEAAYRKKIAALAAESGHAIVAQADDGADHADHPATEHGHAADDGDEGSYFTFAGHEISPLLVLAGLAVAGGGIAVAATSGNDEHKNAAPVASNDTFTTNEDTPTTFDVRTNDTDANGDTLSVTQINGTNITTTSPVTVTGGVVSLGSDGKLTFTPGADYNGAPSFSYTVSDGHGGTATGTVSGTVTAVNDAPVNTVPTTGIAASTGATVTIGGLAVSDVDGAGTYSTTLKVDAGTLSIGTVDGGAAAVGSGTGTLTLTGSLDQINASLKAIGFNGGMGFVGSTTLTVTTSDGQLTDTDTVQINVSQAISGVAQDGYLSGAKVFIDVNGNGVLDDGEPTATTNADGSFAFTTSKPGLILVVGGTNTDTGLPNTVTLSAPLGSTVVNPITTLVAQLVQGGASLDDAKAMVSSALGLPAGVDAASFDFLSPNADPATALGVQKAAVQIATILSIASSAAGAADAADVQSAVLHNIVASIASGSSVDLTDVSTIQNALSGAGLSSDAIADASIHAAAINQTVDQATSAGAIAATVVALTPPDAALPPIAVKDAVTLDEDGHATFNVLANDLDPQHGALTLTAIAGVAVVPGMVVQVQGGSILVGENGALTFTPNADYNGTPSFSYTITDAAGLTQVGTVNLTVTAVNDAPVANSDAAATTAGHAVVIDVLVNDTDVDGDKLSVTQIDGHQFDATHSVDVAGGTISLGENGTLVYTPIAGFSGTPHFDYTISDGHGGTATGTVDVAVTLADGVLPLDPASLSDVVAHADALAAGGVSTLDVVGDTLTLSDDQAGALVHAGLHFAESDAITVDAAGGGTHLSTSLKGLQDLHVSSVVIAAGAAVIDAGGGLGSVAAADLPHFVGAAGGAVDVTLNVGGGPLGAGVDVGTLATSLAHAGIDHIHADAPVSISFAQAQALSGAGLDFTHDSDVTMSFGEGDNIDLDKLAALHVDHLDFLGQTLDITIDEAQHAISAGIDLVESDNVVVHADGTHMPSTLKGLADLHVDTVVFTHTSSVVIEAGALPGAFGAEALPHFVADTTGLPDGAPAPTLDVTVNVAAGAVSATSDLSAFAHNLHSAGVDHIGVDGNGALSLSGAQAIALADAGLNFVHDADVTVNVTQDQVGLITADPAGTAEFGIDHLHADGGAITISDADATALVAAGIDFVTGDAVTVHAAGTHLNSSLSDLQSLHVDAIGVDAGVTQLHISAGDLSALSATALPQFNTAQSDASLNVTLHVSPTDLDQLDRLGTALHQAGIDHFGLDQPIDSYDSDTQAHMAQIASASGISFVYDPEPVGIETFQSLSQEPVTDVDQGLVQQIIAAFDESHDHGTGGHFTVQDDVVPALAESGALRAYTADTLVVDGTHSGDQLLTTLKDIADLGVDKVMVSNTGGPAFVDIGSFSGDELTEVKKLFQTLDSNVPATGSIFSGNDHVALVVDENVAHAIAQVDGGMAKLAAMGFTELDVLMNSGSTAPPVASTAVEVKLIGEDDDLYKHLHHDH